MRAGWAVLLGASGCFSPSSRGLPPPTDGEQSYFLLIEINQGRSLFAASIDDNEALAYGVSGNEPFAEIAYDVRSLSEIGWDPGEIALTAVEGHPLFDPEVPSRVLRMGIDGRGDWAQADWPSTTLSRVRARDEPHPRSDCPVVASDPSVVPLPTLVDGNPVGHIAALLPFDADHLLAATGLGYRFMVDQSNATLIAEDDRPRDYTAGFRDPEGRTWLTGRGQFLRRATAGSTTSVEVLPPGLSRVLTSLDGGMTGDGLELVAIAPYKSNVDQPSFAPEVLTWVEGDQAWTTYPLPPLGCVDTVLCDAWRAVWIGPGHALIVGRVDRFYELLDGRVVQRTLPGCETYTAALLSNGGPLLTCQLGHVADYWLHFDEANVETPMPTTYLRPGLKVPTYTMLGLGDGVVLAGADGYVTYRQGDRACESAQVGGFDIAFVQPLGERFGISTYKFDDTGFAPMQEHFSVRFFDLRLPR